MAEFTHMGRHGFPHGENVNPYRYNNELDYKRFDCTQMSLQLCSVPWDQGEAHIGQRTLSGFGNVVHFGSKTERDKWFDSIPDDECYRWSTKFRDLHTSMTARVPLPCDVAAKYNYLIVSYNLLANDDSLLEGETEGGKRTWCYFVREAKFLASNTTELSLLDDAWQTWIYDLDITSMILERGHAPMLRTTADVYLEDPIRNCGDLLADEGQVYGDLQQVKSTQATSLNADDMQAVIICTGDPRQEWHNPDGNQEMITKAASYYDHMGVPNRYVFSVPAAIFNDFLINVDEQMPQFKQTVQAVCFVARELLSLGAPFTFASTPCHPVWDATTVSKQIAKLEKKDWEYPAKYADLAKLYTWPYSAIELTDERGNAQLIKIEDTSGAISADVKANLIFPYLNLTATLQGIGGYSTSTLRFTNLREKQFATSGRWYQHLMQWDIPSYAVILDAATEYTYSGRYIDNIQADNDRHTTQQNSKNLANASYNATMTVNDGAYTANVTQADAAQTTENNNAGNVIDNAAAQVTANNSVTSNSNAAAAQDASYTNALAQAMQAYDAGLSRATNNNDKDAKNATTGIAAAGGVVNGAASGAISGAASGGLIGAAIGAVGGLVSGGINAATSLATNTVLTEAATANVEAAISYSQEKVTSTSNNNTSRTQIANEAKTANTSATNTCITTSANNTSATMRENAATTRNAQVSAAGTSRDAGNSAAATTRDAQLKAADDTWVNEGLRIENRTHQAALRAPFIYGSTSSADLANVRPQAIYVNVVTQSDYAIQRAGDDFLRFGYAYGKQWEFDGNWCLGKHFTYWQLADFWSTNQIPDKYADGLRFLLLGGVTVWSDPEDIGEVNIYGN